MAKLHLAQQILDIIWPVGSIYLSDNATNPNTKFGGTWVKLSGGFIYGSTITSGNTYSTGNGTGTATNSHTLTIDQMPSHKHQINANWARDKGSAGWGATIANYSTGYIFEPAHLYGEMKETGGGKGHSHNIPYIACSIWRRTA